MLCQSAPINPRSVDVCEGTVSAPACQQLTAAEFFNDVERRAGPVSPYKDPGTRERRIRRRADFDRVFQGGRHNSARLLVLRSVENELQWSRYAYAIPKRVGKAVVRNRLRRRLREILRLTPLKEGFDLLISARNEAAAANFQSLKAELLLLLKRAQLLRDPE